MASVIVFSPGNLIPWAKVGSELSFRFMFTDERAPAHLNPSPVVLRPYQAEALSRLLACRDQGLSRVLVVMPTGTGKTTLFSSLIGTHHQALTEKSLVLAHRRELLDQAYRR